MRQPLQLIAGLASQLGIERRPSDSEEELELYIDDVIVKVCVAGNLLRMVAPVGTLASDPFEQSAQLKRMLSIQAVFMAAPGLSRQTLTIDPASPVLFLYQLIPAESLEISVLVEILQSFVAAVETWREVTGSSLPTAVSF